ncbi:dual specificity protein phosphatase Mpk3 isoform X2 [Folsomia candida]|uniref:dual specificity protein phosphatase Mpk3 isoform X2 n=1 Tax=Folsomia candida TaxID=158441 RepID=UPI000B8EFD3A|nr:dual specificity protein phosphatase Mpk3 isoform X2 [Folsomia candida]
MQDIHPDVVTADQLVNEILRRQSLSRSSPSSNSSSSVPTPADDMTDGGGEMEGSRRGSSATATVDTFERAMSVEEEEEPASFAATSSEVVILDCQNPVDFQECHIRGALNVTFPAIMIRRIAAGKIDIFEKSKELKAKIANAKITFVVYDGFQQNVSCGGTIPSGVGDGELSELVHLIAKKLAQNGCPVATLNGGLSTFREQYPEWVETSESKKMLAASASSSSAEPSPDPAYRPGEVPLLGLGSLASLKIQDDPDACDSCIGLDPDDAFPVEIIPNLYLGNASISKDQSLLEKHNIKHILNVTPDLPNVFEGTIRYLQIPISDHFSDAFRMLGYFIPAIQFIDEGRAKEEGVLVHCLAGISRSVTITMAYLMYKMSLSLNEAYDIVRAKKANISPNFHFMGQLLDFERQLHSQFLSPPALGSSPDSGIEFDRWQSN